MYIRIKGSIPVRSLLFTYIIALPLYYKLNGALGMKTKVDESNVNTRVIGLIEISSEELSILSSLMP